MSNELVDLILVPLGLLGIPPARKAKSAGGMAESKQG